MSNKPVTFHDNAGKKIWHHSSTESHKQATLGLANLRIEDTIGSRATEKRQERHEANNLYIGKLIRIVHFLARNNLPVKSLYQKFIEFLSNELEERIIKQYLENCSKNATYKSHETCDSLIASLDSFFWRETNERIRRFADIVLFADESTNAARSEMLGVFISSCDENTKKFYMDFVSLVEVSSTASDIVMEGVVNTLKARDMTEKKFNFLVLMEQIPCLASTVIFSNN